jgi:hypothetical protein
MKDMGCHVIEKYVEGYHYMIGTTVEKEDGLYLASKDGLKKTYSNNGPEERMVSINHKIYFEIEEEGIKSVKPPLGITPKYIHDQERSNDLVEAIQRYLSAGREIPLEWIEEFNEFFKKVEEIGVISLNGHLHEIESIEEIPEDGEFDVSKVYEQKDVCKWGDFVWQFQGKVWRPYPGPKYASFPYAQKKTIGIYPSEKDGWRKI